MLLAIKNNVFEKVFCDIGNTLDRKISENNKIL
jgi:hypothetical protein